MERPLGYFRRPAAAISRAYRLRAVAEQALRREAGPAVHRASDDARRFFAVHVATWRRVPLQVVVAEPVDATGGAGAGAGVAPAGALESGATGVPAGPMRTPSTRVVAMALPSASRYDSSSA